ncbi:MAG TPA: tetratricopeptide repeat protein [Vicinamibacterales bacterium]|nr:tetratricopeptide repeat protein [Vicinamibacterales bacterium]
MAALIYETAWTRLLGLSMGHTVAAAGAVLAAFMGGLAIGAGVAGRVATRIEARSALRGFAGLEILIGALALMLPLEVAAIRPALALAYADGNGGLAFAAVRITAAIVVVTIPATAMGATLPLLIRWTSSSGTSAATFTARLYASNAFGATLGAIASGFILLPHLGLRMTTTLAAVLNVVAAAIAWRLSRAPARDRPAADSRAGRPADQGEGDGWSARTANVAALAIALSGTASLILQLVWTRLLSLLVGPTTFAFSAMVASFIAGIALGSVLGGWLGRRGPAPAMLALSLLLSGIAGVAASSWSPQFALAVAGATGAGGGFEGVIWRQSLLITGSMLPMTIAFGVAFPLTVGLVVRAGRPAATDVARIYAANTVGAIAGALAGAFILVPRLGLQGSVRVAATLTAAGAVVIALSMVQSRHRAGLGLATLAALGLIWMWPSWDRALLSSGAYKYAPFLPDRHRDALLRAGSLLYYREGAASTISVRRLAGVVSLAIDGKIDASNAGDMLTQRLLAHVPLLLHTAPKRVAIIGLGSGVTMASALRHPVERVDAIEISPEVVEASAQFARENAGALDDPRSRLILGDGRSHMMLGRSTYDVVISEPSNPWMAGVAGLFTREMFEAIRGRLSQDGLACQWAHAYDMSAADFRSIVATFVEVFPHALLWPVGDGDVLLVGSQQPLESRLPLIRTNWQRPGVAADLRTVRVAGPDVLLSLVAGTEASLRIFAAGADIQRDDRLALEFTAPRSAFGRGSEDAVTSVRQMQTAGTAPGLVLAARRSASSIRDRGLMLLSSEAFEGATQDLLAALEDRPDDVELVNGLVASAAPAGRIEAAESRLRAAMSRAPGHAAAAIGVSRILASRGDFDGAEAVLRPFTEAGSSVGVIEQLASVFADAGTPNRLSAAVAGLRSLSPAAEPTAYFAAVLEVMTGRPNEALRIIDDLRRHGGVRARDLTVEATAHAALGRRDDARRSFQAAVAAAPREASRYENLAVFEADSGNDRAAAALFAEALILDPASPVARNGLDAALRRLR